MNQNSKSTWQLWCFAGLCALHKNPDLLSAAACLGLFAQRMACGAYYTASAPGAATVSVAV